jgi:hypothetical protein
MGVRRFLHDNPSVAPLGALPAVIGDNGLSSGNSTSANGKRGGGGGGGVLNFNVGAAAPMTPLRSNVSSLSQRQRDEEAQKFERDSLGNLHWLVRLPLKKTKTWQKNIFF